MTTTLRSLAIFSLVIVSAVAACGGDDDTNPTGTAGTGGSGGSGGTGGTGGSGGATDAGADSGETLIASSMGEWDVYRDPYGDGGTGPISTMSGTVQAYWSGTEMRVKLSVSGLPPNRPFGSHVHKLACGDMKAGGHYQDTPFPADSGATDPMYANAMNEVWLDFTTDAQGSATVETKVKWRPRAGEAKSVMIHDQMTMTGGTAGAKLACISVPF
jgi:Cu-Zn family superoxide dismutase